MLERQGLLILANHPTLIDTVFLMAFVKHADCIVNNNLWRNPFTGGPVRSILGMGVDYGIFLQEHPSRQDKSSWLAVGLSALSTLLSFGLLGLSQTPALQAFGMTMLFGVALVLHQP